MKEIIIRVFETNRTLQILTLFLLAVGTVTAVYLSGQKTQTQQKASTPNQTEYGFNLAMYANPSIFNPPSYLTLNLFKGNVDELVANHQQWVRFGIADWEVVNDCNNKTQTITWNYLNLLKYDQAVDYAKQKGLKIVLVNVASPSNIWWPNCKPNAPLSNYQAMSQVYYQFLATRYKGKIDIWQVGNEADIGSFRDYSSICLINTYEGCTPAPPNYMSDWNSVLTAVRATLKSVDPNNAMTTNAGNWNGNEYDGWVQYFTPINGNLDILSADVYSNDSTYILSNMTTWVIQLKQHFGKPVMIMETGMCSATPPFSQAQQAQYVPEDVQKLTAANPMAVIVYQYQDIDTGTSPCDNGFGIKDKQGNRKLAYNPVINTMYNPGLPTNTPTPTNTPRPTPTRTPTPSPTLIPSITPSVTPTNTPTPSPTRTPSVTPTRIPSVTPSVTPTPTGILPTNTPFPTETPPVGHTTLSLSLSLQGVASNGGNLKPLHPQRIVKVQIFNNSNQQVGNDLSTTVTFDQTTGLFTGIVDAGTLPTNIYTIKVKTDRYLRKLIFGIQTITKATINILPQTTLTVGDVNNDNLLDIIDYNLLSSCFGSKQQTSSCTTPDTSDLDDNGIIDGIDYNLMIRNMGTQGGD